MELKEQLRMGQVKRYPICFTNREQSVAEHSFGVMLITMELCKFIDDREQMRADQPGGLLIAWAFIAVVEQ